MMIMDRSGAHLLLHEDVAINDMKQNAELLPIVCFIELDYVGNLSNSLCHDFHSMAIA